MFLDTLHVYPNCFDETYPVLILNVEELLILTSQISTLDGDITTWHNTVHKLTN